MDQQGKNQEKAGKGNTKEINNGSSLKPGRSGMFGRVGEAKATCGQ